LKDLLWRLSEPVIAIRRQIPRHAAKWNTCPIVRPRKLDVGEADLDERSKKKV
jgi:hypothetical protein